MTRECRKYEKDGTEKSSFRTAKKGGKKNYPVNQNFAQLTEKNWEAGESVEEIRKKGKKCRYEVSDSNSE